MKKVFEDEVSSYMMNRILDLIHDYYIRRDVERYSSGFKDAQKEIIAFLYFHQRCLKTKRYGIEGRWYGKILNAPDPEKEYQEWGLNESQSESYYGEDD
jgi:hypothetical protein